MRKFIMSLCTLGVIGMLFLSPALSIDSAHANKNDYVPAQPDSQVSETQSMLSDVLYPQYDGNDTAYYSINPNTQPQAAFDSKQVDSFVKVLKDCEFYSEMTVKCETQESEETGIKVIELNTQDKDVAKLDLMALAKTLSKKTGVETAVITANHFTTSDVDKTQNLVFVNDVSQIDSVIEIASIVDGSFWAAMLFIGMLFFFIALGMAIHACY